MSKPISSSPKTPVTLYFEPLEPRILLSADLLGGVIGDINQDDDNRGYQEVNITAASLDLQRTFKSSVDSSASQLAPAALGLALESDGLTDSWLDKIGDLLQPTED